MGIPKDLIKYKVDLVDYINKYYPKLELQRIGCDYKCRCPFHKNGQERTPSFTVYRKPEEEFYRFRCYACGDVYGDIINFVQLMENTDFKGACKMIAQNEGINYSVSPPNPYHEKYKDEMVEHSRRYWINLQNNEFAMKYLKESRGLTKETIDLFRLGLVPNEEGKIRPNMDYISNRISIPILEVKPQLNDCKCIAMGYRSLDASCEKKYKYINDKNQDGRPADLNRNEPGRDPNLKGVFLKRECLYGLAHSLNTIKEVKSVVVVEGYFDVMSLYQSGIQNVVGTMNASLTEFNMNVLRNLTENILFYFDNDSTGFANTIKLLPVLYQKGFNVKLVLPKEKEKFDAADMCKSMDFNKSKVLNYIKKNTISAIHFQINELLTNYEKIMFDYNRKTLIEIEKILANVNNPIDKKIYKEYADKRLNL